MYYISKKTQQGNMLWAHLTKMELCDSVQLDPEKNNSWQGVNQEDADGLTFFFYTYFCW